MKIHHLGAEEAFASVQSRPEGLPADEAKRRLIEYGPNQVEAARRESLVKRFGKSFTHFFAIVLWLAAALAFLAEASDPGQGMLTLGLSIIGVIAINGGFSFWQEYRAERALEALQCLLPRQVKVRRDGNVMLAPVADIVPGDVIFLETGDKVPADCRIIESFSVRVNNATITGESLPHSRDAAISEEPDFLHSDNVLLASTIVVSGEATALVFATGAHTEFGRIAHLAQATRETLSPLQQEIVRLSRLVGLLAFGLGAFFFIVGQAIGLPFWGNFLFAIGIIVANVPEGLLPTLTLALAMGSQRMAKRNALVRHLPAVETLGAATVICTDKTGTLTENRLTVRWLWLDGQWVPVAEQARVNSLAVAHRHFFEIAFHSHTLKLSMQAGQRQWLGDPLEVALVEMAERIRPDAIMSLRLDEIPFDSRRRRMSTLHALAEGKVLFMKGAPEAVLPICEHMETGGGPALLDGPWRERIAAAQDEMAQRGLRVLALAWKPVPDQMNRGQLEAGLTFAGLVGLEDPPRTEVPEAIVSCHTAGIRVIMVTGDHAHTALAVARNIGLVKTAHPVVITGGQLNRLSNTQLQLALDAQEIIFARVAADQKMRIVTALKRKKETVAVTGDGVNDAPALKKADIGIAMGRCGTDVAREAADIILLDDNFATILAAIEEGRAVYANIRKFLTYILTSNIPELVPYLAFILFKIPLPLTIIQILAVDLGTDMVPALALGVEPANRKTMHQPPRPRTERLLNFALIARAYLWLGLLQATAAMAAFFFVLHHGGWHHGDLLATNAPLYRQATTACLSSIIVMQVVNVFLCRSRHDSIFQTGLCSNPLILGGIAAELALICFIDYSAWGNAVFGTAPLPWEAWLFMLPFALAMLLLEESRKWLFRWRESRAGAPGRQSGQGC